MSVLDDLFYAIDTPGAYARGALSGRFGQRASGEDVLRSWGMDNPNKWAGIGAEMLLDPINLIPGGLGLKVLRGAKKATQANKAARIMIKKGAMPAELAATTKIGVGGKPIRVFHGTKQPFDSIDPKRFDPEPMTVPGHHTTPDPNIAGHYAIEEGGTAFGMAPKGLTQKSPHIRQGYMHSEDMFDISSQINYEDVSRIVVSAEENGFPETARKLAKEIESFTSGGTWGYTLYGNSWKGTDKKFDLLGDLSVLVSIEGKHGRGTGVADTLTGPMVSKILRDAGWDSVKTRELMRGNVAGIVGRNPGYDVHIGLMGDSQMYLPHVAPAIKRVPKPRIGLRAAGTVGYQAGTKIGLRPREEQRIGLRR